MKFLQLSICLAALLLACSGIPSKTEALVRISQEVYINEVVDAGGHVWVATDEGAYRVDGDKVTQVLRALFVMTVADVGGKIWLGSEDGIFEVFGDSAVPVEREVFGGLGVTVVLRVDDLIWVGTDRGLYRIEDNEPSKTVIAGQIYSIEEIDGRIWVGTNRNAYHFDDLRPSGPSLPEQQDAPVPVFPDGMLVSEIVDDGDSVWLVTNRDFGLYGPCFQITGGKVKKRLQDHQVTSLKRVRSEIWFGTTSGVFRLLNSGRLVRKGGFTGPVNTVNVIAGRAWIGTTQGVLREYGGGFLSIPADEVLNVKGTLAAQGYVWVWGDRGLFRREAQSFSGYLGAVLFAVSLGMCGLFFYLMRRRPGYVAGIIGAKAASFVSKVEFFVSYNDVDREWAEWVAWKLEGAGFKVIIQAWDLRPGSSFIVEMDSAIRRSDKIIALLSESYLRSEFSKAEWAAAIARDPRGVDRRLVLFRVEDCDPTGLFAGFVYVDLFGLSEDDAEAAVLGAFSERVKPLVPPHFPGRERAVAYPGGAGERKAIEHLSLTSEERLALVTRLNALPPRQFNILSFALKPPPGLIPPMPAAQADRVDELLRWAEGSDGPGLGRVAALLKTLGS